MLKNLLLLSAFSTFAVIIIIGFNVYHNYTLSSLPNLTKKRVVSIPASFDKETLDELKIRTPIVVDLFEKTKVISEDSQGLSSTPTPTDIVSQVASSSSIPL